MKAITESQLFLSKRENLSSSMFVGNVVDVEDPSKLGRVKVEIPLLGDSFQTNWARVTTPFCNDDYGMAFLPEVGSEVIIVFLGKFYSDPVVMGSLWSGNQKPVDMSSDHSIKQIKTKSGFNITIDESDGKEEFIVTNKDENTFVQLDFKTGNISFKAKKDVKIEAGGNVVIKGTKIQLN